MAICFRLRNSINVDDMLAVLVLLLCGASALEFRPTFRFAKVPTVFRKTEEICKICYGEFDCLVMNKVRCEYNAAVDAIFEEDSAQEVKNDNMKIEVDAMMYDLMLNETLMQNYNECIPLISSYTTCNRDNICIGCETCNCNMEGKWNCTMVQKCKRETLNIDHRVLVIVMENLMPDSNSSRSKRSIDTAHDKTRPHKVTYEELSEWMYGSAPIISKKINDTFKKEEESDEHTTEMNGSPKNISSSYVDKDASKSNDSVDEAINDVNDISIPKNNFTYIDIRKHNSDDNTHKFWQMLAIEEGKELAEPTSERSTKVDKEFVSNNSNFVTDNRNLLKNDTNAKLNAVMLTNTDTDFKEDMNSITFSNMINVFKRDVSHLNETTTTVKPNTIKTEAINTTESEKTLYSNILDPITIMIENKNEEIKQLIDIKESLLKFIKKYKLNSSLVCNSSVNSNIIFLKTKLHEDMHTNDVLRRTYMNSNTALLNKYLNKLQLDINEVLRDILGIRKYQKSTMLSKDFKILLQAIVYFKKNHLINREEYPNPRRQLHPHNHENEVNYIRRALVKILNHLDKDMPTSNAMSMLSLDSKEILKTVVNMNYVDDFGISGFNINKPHYNFTNDLITVGVKWHDLITDIINTLPADRLYSMKLLHTTLAQDIIKIGDALALLKFAYSRRMSPDINEDVGNDIVKRIYTDLIATDTEWRRFIKKNNSFKEQNVKKLKKKKSFFNKIKNLLINSKNNFVKRLRKKQVNSNVIKELERKRVQDSNKQKFLEVMQKWQDNLDLISTRNKRSIRGFKNRMKNIIPKYLRGKVNPALDAKSSKKKISKNPVRPAKQVTNESNNLKPTVANQIFRSLKLRLNKNSNQVN